MYFWAAHGDGGDFILERAFDADVCVGGHGGSFNFACIEIVSIVPYPALQYGTRRVPAALARFIQFCGKCANGSFGKFVDENQGRSIGNVHETSAPPVFPELSECTRSAFSTKLNKTLGPDEWLLFLKLPDYTARKKPQRKPEVI